VYCPSGVHLHLISSSESTTQWTEFTSSYKVTNSRSSSIDCIGYTCEIHLFCVVACFTVMFFRLDFWNRAGAINLGALLFNQLECQNMALSPFPMVTIVDAWNRSLSVLSQGTARPAHGRWTCCHLNHSHRNLSARANRSRSRMPSPPKILGAHVVG
jgi:hypothetical protein